MAFVIIIHLLKTKYNKIEVFKIFHKIFYHRIYFNFIYSVLWYNVVQNRGFDIKNIEISLKCNFVIAIKLNKII